VFSALENENRLEENKDFKIRKYKRKIGAEDQLNVTKEEVLAQVLNAFVT